MSTRRLKASHMSEARLLPGFAFIVSFVGAVIDVFADAGDLARAMHKRGPFAQD